MASASDPKVDLIEGVWVVRDDLYPGGTKARFAAQFFDGADEVVYASPCEGGAQTALAQVGRDLGKRVTIFCSKRSSPHPRSLLAKALGAQVIQVRPGYLSQVSARSRYYCADTGARLLPFGLDTEGALDAISEAASKVDLKSLGIEEVWCAAGSGVLMRGLQRAWSNQNGLRFIAVRIGRPLEQREVGSARIVEAPWTFEQRCLDSPFPSDPHYDAKAWAMLKRQSQGKALFWNVAAPATSGSN